MLPAGLLTDQAPPISVPFRFFLTAPLFLVLAALVLAWRGGEVFDSRLSLAALAVTHLLTLGFMSMCMVGAMTQLLPVVGGAPMPLPLVVAAISHTGLAFGTPLLAAGFLFEAPRLLGAGSVALGIGFAAFIVAAAAALLRSRARDGTRRALGLPVLALAVTIALGVALGWSLSRGIPLINASMRQLHPGWGLLGWLGLLTIGVAFRVVPMFQITPPYPTPMMKFLAAAVILVLALWSIALWLGAGTWGLLAALALAAACVAFAVTTIVLQRRRRRRQPDVTLAFWRIGMACLVAASVIWALRILLSAEASEGVDVLIGSLALVGFATSIINGMLYKIVPFLAWFHLQSVARNAGPVPTMKKMLGEADQRLQFRFHVAALALLVAAIVQPGVLVYPAALALGASGVLLEVNLLRVLRRLRNPTSSTLAPQKSRSATHSAGA